MIKLRFFKFLSIFIPYFKRKMMNKDTMLNCFDREIQIHANNYADIRLFNMQIPSSTCSNISGAYIKIVYKIHYQAIDFSISSEYFENDMKIKMSCDFDNCDEEFLAISEFYKHFRSINKANQLQIFNIFKPYIMNGTIL
jgi:hypothetical protein